jgi:hypothetical protein
MSPKKLWPSFMFAVCFGCLLLLYFRLPTMFSYLKARTNALSSLSVDSKGFELKLIGYNGEQFPEEVREQTWKFISAKVKSGQPLSMSDLALGLHRRGLLDRPVIVNPTPRVLVVVAEARAPLFRVSIDDVSAFLSSSGALFRADVEDPLWPNKELLPLDLSGLVKERRKPLTFDEFGRVELSAKESGMLSDVIEISQLLASNEIEVKKFFYRENRGLGVVSSNNVEIILGRSPFDFKLRKLDSILQNISENATSAQRIELDYDGKAFIKF